MTLPIATRGSLEQLQTHIGAGNRARGFREDEEELDSLTDALTDSVNIAEERLSETGQPQTLVISLGTARAILKALQNAKLHGHANRLLLIVSEVVEAHEALRSGHGVNETYYIDEDGNKTHERFRPDGSPRKPEGVPSEIADAAIRSLDFFDNAKIDGAGIIVEKDEYNATRPYKHGRKF